MTIAESGSTPTAAFNLDERRFGTACSAFITRLHQRHPEIAVQVVRDTPGLINALIDFARSVLGEAETTIGDQSATIERVWQVVAERRGTSSTARVVLDRVVEALGGEPDASG